MRRSIFALVIGATLVGLSVGLPVQALDRSDLGLSVSFEKRVDENDYPPMGVNDPLAVTLHPEDCKISPACDFIPVSISAPPDTPYRLVITMSFTHAEGANDIDLYMWENQVEIVKNDDGSETRENHWTDIGSAASGAMPEVMKLADMPSSHDLLEYALTPLNWTGSSPYHMKAEIIPTDVPDVSDYDFSVPSGQYRPPPNASRDPDTGALEFSSATKPAGGETEKLDPVKVPGADGELTEHELLAVKGQATEEQRSRAPLVAAVVAILALGAGTFLWFFIRSRRRGEEPA